MNGDNLRTIAAIARAFAWIVLTCAGLSVLSTVGWIAGGTSEPNRILIIIVGLSSLLVWLAFVLSIVPVLMWVFRAHANLAAAGLDGLSRQPGWVAASYFVPVANFFVPFLGMRELYNRSAGEPAEFADASVGPVASWWACHMAAVLTSAVVTISTLIDAVPGIYVTTPAWADIGISVLSTVLLAGSAWFLQQIIAEVTAMQRGLVNVAATFA